MAVELHQVFQAGGQSAGGGVTFGIPVGQVGGHGVEQAQHYLVFGPEGVHRVSGDGFGRALVIKVVAENGDMHIAQALNFFGGQALIHQHLFHFGNFG